MTSTIAVRVYLPPALSALAVLLWVAPGEAQVTDLIVGITPTCPYGLSACWGGAYEALGRLEGVDSVAKTPDSYNCTAHLHLKEDGLPNFEKWPDQFKSSVGEVYLFRGVEATIEGSIDDEDGVLVLHAPGIKPRIVLGPLQHKLQWNFRKGAGRQPEPDERDAYPQLAAGKKEAKNAAFKVQATGPLKATDKGYILEVREFFPVAPKALPRR
jgi:galactose oxidase